MDKIKILAVRKELKEFLSSSADIFEFIIDCKLEERRDKPFKVLFPGIKLFLFYCRHTLARIAQFIDYSPFKILIYRLLGMKIGKGVYIAPDVVIDVQHPKLIEISDYVFLGWGCRIFTHDFDGRKFRVGRVKIGRGSVIGGFATIRGGVTVGEMALVALNRNVLKNVPNGAGYEDK